MSVEWQEVENATSITGKSYNLYFDDYYIAYNPGSELLGNTPMTSIIFANDNGEDQFLILNGDFRIQFSEIGPKGLDECIEFYNTNKKSANLLSIILNDILNVV